VTNASVNDECATTDGVVALDAATYHCNGDAIGVNVATPISAGGVCPVSVKSTLEPAGEALSLLETPAGSGNFLGSIASTPDALRARAPLLVDGDTITATYVDANDGKGDGRAEERHGDRRLRPPGDFETSWRSTSPMPRPTSPGRQTRSPTASSPGMSRRPRCLGGVE